MKDLLEFLEKYSVRFVIEEEKVIWREVNLQGGRIKKLPDSIGNLICDTLILDDNQLTSLPKSIGQLKADYIYLSNNFIKELPNSITNIACFILDLSFNQIASLPENIGDIKADELYLSNNKLETLPNSFSKIKCKELYLDDNPLNNCMHLFKEFKDDVRLKLDDTCMYKEDYYTVKDYRKDIDLAYELKKPDNTGIKSMFDMGLF